MRTRLCEVSHWLCMTLAAFQYGSPNAFLLHLTKLYSILDSSFLQFSFSPWCMTILVTFYFIPPLNFLSFYARIVKRLHPRPAGAVVESSVE